MSDVVIINSGIETREISLSPLILTNKELYNFKRVE